MTIAYNDLFERIGAIGHLAYLVNGHQDEYPVAFETLLDLYNDDHAWSAPVALAQESLVRTPAVIPSGLVGLANTTLLEMVGADVPTAGVSLSAAMTELIRQMKADSQSVNTCDVTVTSTAFASPTNTGDGVLVTTNKRGDGVFQENLIAEEARLTCTGDSQSSTATEDREPFRFAGAPTDGLSVWDYRWPVGSGASATLSAIDSAQDASATGNLLTNADWEDWAAAGTMPTGWTITTGTVNVDFIRESSVIYDGAFSARFPTVATLTAVTQTLTQSQLTPLGAYAFNMWARKNGTVSTGTLVVELIDGSGSPAVINDDAGTANSFSVDLTALTTSFAAVNGVFRLPRVLPTSGVKLRLRISVAITGGGSAYIDRLAMGRVSFPYPGGPGLAVFSGATAFVVGDGWDIETTNDRGGADFLATFQALFDRLYGMRAMGLILPSNDAGAETQADTLIQS